MPLNKCEVSLTLNLSEKCVLTSRAYREEVTAQGDNPPVDRVNTPTGATSKIKYTKLCVPVVILLDENENKLLEQLNTGFKRTVK